MAKTPFKLKSGNKPSFKEMGGSPNKAKDDDRVDYGPDAALIGSAKAMYSAKAKKGTAFWEPALEGLVEGIGKRIKRKKEKKEAEEKAKTDASKETGTDATQTKEKKRGIFTSKWKGRDQKITGSKKRKLKKYEKEQKKKAYEKSYKKYSAMSDDELEKLRNK